MLLIVLAFVFAAPAIAGGGRHTVSVPPPGGADDTASIQAALDQCVAHGPGCTVQLAAGTYRTSQLLAYDFKGTFKGMGPSEASSRHCPTCP